MIEQIKMNSVNQIGKGNTLIKEDSEINCVCMVLKGRVAADAKGSYTILRPGSFLGINDLHIGRSLCNYVAVDDVMFYAFPVSNAKSIRQIITANKDYGGLMVYSMSQYIAELTKTREDLLNRAQEVYAFLKDSYEKYCYFGDSEEVKFISDNQFTELHAYTNEQTIDEPLLSFYNEDAKLSLDLHKTYYADGINMVLCHAKNQSQLINNLIIECREAAEYLEHTLYLLMNQGDHNLFMFTAGIIISAEKKKVKTDSMMALLDKIIEKINRIEMFFHDKIGRVLHVDRDKIEKVYFAVMTGTDFMAPEKTSAEEAVVADHDIAQSVKHLENSLQKIMDYSEWDTERVRTFTGLMDAFFSLTDKLSAEENVRKLRHAISKEFYHLYKTVFMKAYKAPTDVKAIQLFLDYCFLDERVLEDAKLAELCAIKKEEQTLPCNVYTIREWLVLIYEGKKEPSKSEFDMDFVDTIRDMKKRNVMSDEDLKKYAENMENRVDFEIQNMFALNHRLANGNISNFVPFLYSDGINWSFASSKITKTSINEVIEKMLQIDPTVFHHEVMFTKPEEGIKKEYIIKQIFPDIIILPTVGMNGIMWQEITGKRRDSKGRFLFPQFFEGNLEDAVVRVLGRFRWEMCRSEQGSAWNNIQIKSLTSEYSDYLQFYKKNRELSEDRKEKLKLQLQKARGNNREAFVFDYELWIKNEAFGAIRLNKVAREIIATYCPFSKAIRKSIETQPIFEEAMARFNRNLAKKIYELDLRHRALEREKVELPQVMIQTYQYYQNM